MSDASVLIDWHRHWNRSLLGFLGRRVRAGVDIEDLAQETYLQLLRARTLSDVRNPQAYLMKVARHVLSEWLRNQPPTDISTLMGEEPFASPVTAEFEMDATCLQECLEGARLSLTMRDVLLMRLRDELSYKEIAGKLGMRDKQVKRYLTRGYERLRQLHRRRQKGQRHRERGSRWTTEGLEIFGQ